MTSQSSSKVSPIDPNETYGATAAKIYSLDDKQMKSLLDQGFTRGKVVVGTMVANDGMYYGKS
jgi:hypothetical protein